MKLILSRFTAYTLILLALGELLFALVADRGSAAVVQTPIVKKFHLYATDGYTKLPDGSSLYLWGYSLSNEPGSATYPAPTLEVNEGDHVEITLTNIGAKKSGIKKLSHTIHFHGLDTDQANDGVPHTSAPISVGESFTYQFTADVAGSYFYHCHVDTIEHLQMGMYGAFVVKAKGGGNEAWTGGPSYDKEYVLLLNEIDTTWHKAVEEGTEYDRTAYHPTFWTINGKAFPDTEDDPTTRIDGAIGQKVLIRLINAGYESHSFHMHGFHFQIIASDGRPLPQPLEKDTVLLGPGERYDLLVTFDQAGSFPLHSHNITDNTNNGVYPGGLHTMIEVTEAGTLPGMKMDIRLKAGQPSAIVNGKSVSLVSPPIVVKGVTYVPLRFIGEQLGAEVKWLATEKSVVYSTTDKKLQFWLGSDQAMVNGVVIKLPVLLREQKGALMVPLRFVASELGAKVDRDASGGIIVSADIRSATSMQMPGDHDPTDSSSGEDGGASTSSGDPELSHSMTVQIGQSAFMPDKLSVKKGQSVKWINEDTQIHTVYDLYDSFKSANLLKNSTFSNTFTNVGTYTYYCSVHPGMQGEITVTEQ
ncbi:stalk domain-containing protein [Cohnella sp. WQ 127256]|uniref:stalk domain-containing protein n=1 Tax=Cohnella sp. WQ 127256 TaxID=2938790 RepID=UPI0021176F1B|nr:stalk domain-containing protein [Cohnella sp. WQ 127256]